MTSIDVTFSIKMSHGMSSSFLWAYWAWVKAFPLESRSWLCASISVVSSWSLYETTENYELRVINLGLSMIVSWLWNISLLFHLWPHIFIWIKLEGILSVKLRVDDTTIYNNLVSKYSWFVMGNISWKLPFALYLLPWYTEFWIWHQFLNTLKAQSPHVAHWTLFNISTTMNVKIVV